MTLEQLKKIIDAGPPVEPSNEKPGRLMSAVTRFEAEFKKRNTRDPSIEEIIGFIVHILDHKQWEEEMGAYNQMKRMYEANLAQQAQAQVQTPEATAPRIVAPSGIITP